jgi:glycosyltransferase involved in cell wall biosynthesis
MTRHIRFAALVAGGTRRTEDIVAGREPKRDYLELVDALGAQLIEGGADKPEGLRSGLRAAWTAFKRRGEYDVIMTNEGSGIPLALLLRLARARRGQVMVGHWLTPPKKSLPFKWLGLRDAIDRVVVYCTAQERFALEQLRVPRARVAKVLHAADAEFWHPLGHPQSGICSAGLERRDYAPLLEAVRGLDLTLTIAAGGSPWTKHDPLAAHLLPPNVVKRRIGYQEMRELYDRSEFVVVPLQDVDFQAGSLVMYEAMAMGKAVIATRTAAHRYGDIVRDGETGLLVPPGDVKALREAIIRLHEDPAEARRLGANGRRVVEGGLNHDVYLRDMVRICREVGAELGKERLAARFVGRRTAAPRPAPPVEMRRERMTER